MHKTVRHLKILNLTWLTETLISGFPVGLNKHWLVPTSLAPHERLTDLAVVPREKPHTGAAAREQPRDSPVIER